METNAILIIDDDPEDLELICEAFKELPIESEIKGFDDAVNAMDFLRDSVQSPLLILCDVNMYNINGFELRQLLYNDDKLRLKSTPFLFISTSHSRNDVIAAYNLPVQGYFTKPDSYEGFVEMASSIIQYWQRCKSPNSKGLLNN